MSLGSNVARPGPWTAEINRAKALAVLGSISDACEFFDDMLESTGPTAVKPTWTSIVASGGTIETPTQPTDGSGGIVRLRSNATANGSIIMTPSRNPIANVTTAKWYASWRFRLGNTAAADAVAAVGAGLRGNFITGKTISIGMFKALSTTNFVAQYDGILAGTAIDLGVALDNTLMHTGELWGVGSTTLNTRFDGGTIRTAVMAAAPTTEAMSLVAFAANGGTAADRDGHFDWCYMLVARG